MHTTVPLGAASARINNSGGPLVGSPPRPPLPSPRSPTPSPPAPTFSSGEATDALLLRDAAPHGVDALFVLASLLVASGRRRLRVQDYFYALGVLPVALRGLATVPWASLGDFPPQGGQRFARLHGPHCRCSADTEGPLQLLRLLHNMCDREAPLPGEY